MELSVNIFLCWKNYLNSKDIVELLYRKSSTAVNFNVFDYHCQFFSELRGRNVLIMISKRIASFCLKFPGVFFSFLFLGFNRRDLGLLISLTSFRAFTICFTAYRIQVQMWCSVMDFSAASGFHCSKSLT